MTISELMVLQKVIKNRVSDLQSIRNANAVRTRTYYYEEQQSKERTEIEPQYDPKAVDTKIAELSMVLFKADTAIKRANAKTETGFEVDVDKLLEPIK